MLSLDLEDEEESDEDGLDEDDESLLPSDFVSDLVSDLPSALPDSDLPSDFEASGLEELELVFRLSFT